MAYEIGIVWTETAQRRRKIPVPAVPNVHNMIDQKLAIRFFSRRCHTTGSAVREFGVQPLTEKSKMFAGPCSYSLSKVPDL